MKIALTSINPVIGNFQTNIKQIRDKAAQALAAGCELLILPELALSGSPPRDLLRRSGFLEAQDQAFTDLLRNTKDIAVLCGIISRDSSTADKLLYNSAVLFEGGKVTFLIHKHFLETYGSYRESDYFEQGEVFLPVPFRGLRLGITLGREIMPEEDNCGSQGTQNPIAQFQQQGGADLFVNLAASPFSLGESRSRLDRLSAICRRYSTPLIHVNQLGGQDSLLFDGRCLVLNREGEVSRDIQPFEEGMLFFDSELPDQPEETGKKGPPDLEVILRGLITGIGDYVRKSGFCKVVIGLSGGVDSALTCALACRALGPENVLGAALPSEISSPESTADARQLAENLGIEFKIIPINEPVQAMKNTLAPSFQGCREDLTEANLQARIRGNLLMALANKFNRLLLATGNKSEVAVGYCTLYGDTCGALAPLADLPKTMIYELAELVNNDSGGVIPGSIMTKAPSAELIPGQKDQDELPPYEILDAVIEDRLEKELPVAEIIAKGHDPVMVRDIIRRIEKNEFKRRQLPPKLWVTSRKFGIGTDLPLTAESREEHG